MIPLDRKDITAIVVTRGDVRLRPIMESLTPVFEDILVWDNQRGLFKYGIRDGLIGHGRVTRTAKDLAVYGRYEAIRYARTDLIYVQDDDCLVDLDTFLHLAGGFDLDKIILSNMPESRWHDYDDSCLVGWGALFHRDLPNAAFARFSHAWHPAVESVGPLSMEPGLTSFYRECDVVFTVLTPSVKVDAGFQHLPWAEDPARAMFLSPRPDRELIYRIAREVRDQ